MVKRLPNWLKIGDQAGFGPNFTVEFEAEIPKKFGLAYYGGIFFISLQTAACWCQLRQIYNRILGFCQDQPESMQRLTTWDSSPFMPSRSHRLLPTPTQIRINASLWDSQGIVRNTVSHLFKTPQAQFSLAYHSKLAQVIFICH